MRPPIVKRLLSPVGCGKFSLNFQTRCSNVVICLFLKFVANQSREAYFFIFDCLHSPVYQRSSLFLQVASQLANKFYDFSMLWLVTKIVNENLKTFFKSVTLLQKNIRIIVTKKPVDFSSCIFKQKT